MFRWYGFLGIVMIIFAEFVIFLKIEPFATWYIPIIWLGYIFLADSIVYMLKGNSLISNRPGKFLVLASVSVIFWYVFEIYNKFLRGWQYSGLPESDLVTFAMGSLSFSTIVPAVFETWELLKSLRLFDRVKFHFKLRMSRYSLYLSIVIGFIFLTIPFALPIPIMWLLVWSGFILFLDPLLFLFHNEKSLLGQLKKRKISVIFSLFVAGYICGFLWEFWNYWAITKWYYTVPFLDSIKIFEIPVFGFLAYGPFALELYVMYNFTRFLFSKRVWRIA